MTKLDWRDAYKEAYLKANNGKAEIVKSAAGWYRLRVDGRTTKIQYRRKEIEQMTKVLLDRASGTIYHKQEVYK